LPPEQLVNIIEQQQVIVQQQAMIGQLQQEIERLKVNQQTNSQTFKAAVY